MNGDHVKKLLLILMASTCIIPSSQGMEKIKSWFGFTKKAQPTIAADQTCRICHDNLKTTPPEPITQLPCHEQHIFHTDCINLWKTYQLSMHGEATCPYCNKTYSKTLKADVLPSLTYTASMLFSTLHYSYTKDQIPQDPGTQCYFAILDITAASFTPHALSLRFSHKQYLLLNLRNLAITTTLFLASAKYLENFPIFNNKDATYTSQALTLCPLILSYFTASKLLKYETLQ